MQYDSSAPCPPRSAAAHQSVENFAARAQAPRGGAKDSGLHSTIMHTKVG